MNPRGNTLKLTAVSALVVLTLTGFSTGRGSSGGSGDGGGGGCSSSSQDHDSSSGSGGGSHRDDDDDDDTGGSGGSGGSTSASLRDATVELLTCVSRKAPYATVEVTNPNTVDGTFTVMVTFDNSTGGTVVEHTQTVDVPAGGTATARVEVTSPDDVRRIHDCVPDRYALAVR